MTVEQLLKPRYKVIGDYPGNVQPIGHIHEVVGDTASVIYWCMEKEKYPHLFKKLQWWEERSIEEMPEYVKIAKSECSIAMGCVLRVVAYGIYEDHIAVKYGNEGQPFALLLTPENTDTHDLGEEIRMHCANLLPATAEEYNQYITQTTNNGTH